VNQPLVQENKEAIRKKAESEWRAGKERSESEEDGGGPPECPGELEALHAAGSSTAALFRIDASQLPRLDFPDDLNDYFWPLNAHSVWIVVQV
jgi:hypothetical protein